IFLAFFFNHSSTAARMHHPTERCRSLANFSKPWSCSALSRILKISILMYDSVLHNDYRCQPQIATTAKCHSLTSPLKEEDCARARFTAATLAGCQVDSYTGGPANRQFRRWGRPLVLTFLGLSNRACKC